MPEFSIRLESAINKLLLMAAPSSLDRNRQNISEKLHGDMLPWLKTVTGNMISDKHRVVILIDNLDKAWDQTQDLTRVSDLLFGLLPAPAGTSTANPSSTSFACIARR